jgi:hypothetical protein
LESHYAKDLICPTDFDDPQQRKAAAERYRSMQGFDLYVGGHYGYDVYAAVNRGHLPITNFRHPAARLVSLYNYFRLAVPLTPEQAESSAYTAVRMAQTSSFEAFALCDDPRVAMHTCDHHFRQLANTPWSMICSRTEAQVTDLVLSMPWFYVCEYPELSYRWARTALALSVDQVPLENVTPVRDGETTSVLRLSDALYAEILGRNRRDLAIYAAAVEKLTMETSASRVVRQAIGADKGFGV